MAKRLLIAFLGVFLIFTVACACGEGAGYDYETGTGGLRGPSKAPGKGGTGGTIGTGGSGGLTGTGGTGGTGGEEACTTSCTVEQFRNYECQPTCDADWQDGYQDDYACLSDGTLDPCTSNSDCCNEIATDGSTYCAFCVALPGTPYGATDQVGQCNRTMRPCLDDSCAMYLEGGVAVGQVCG